LAFKVVQTTDLPGVSDHLKQAFSAIGIEYQLAFCATDEEIIAASRDADVLVVVPADQRITRKVIEGLPRCRHILGLISGYDGIDIAAATEHGVLVTNFPDLYFEEVADHTMALILACSRKIVELDKLVKNGEWVVDRMGSRLGLELWPKLTRLQGQTLGIIGFGHIARSLVPKAKGFEMKLITYDPYLLPADTHSFDVERVELDQLLQESDFISVLTPLTAETRGMLGLEEFKKMKPTAYVINTARGPIINREALHTALTQGWIAGAGLDTTEPEPSTPENNPLLSLDNVIMTAHSAGQDRIAFAKTARLTVEQVLRISREEWPENLVNPEAKERYLEKWGA